MRVRARKGQKQFEVLAADDSGRVVRWVSKSVGDHLVSKGSMRRVITISNIHVGYQVVGEYKRPESAMISMMVARAQASTPKPVTISRAEVEANAGTGFRRGKSRTAHLNEDQRVERIRRNWRGEDIVETAQQKLAVYRQTH